MNGNNPIFIKIYSYANAESLDCAEEAHIMDMKQFIAL